MDLARGHVAAIRKLGNMQGQITCNLGPEVVAKALGSIKALLRLYKGSIKALLLLLKALSRLCQGSVKALLRLCSYCLRRY